MIDMFTVMAVIQDKITPMMCNLNQRDVTDTEDSREKAEVRSHKAEISRQLLELADLFALCEVAVRNEFWIMKGRGVDLEIGVWDE